MRLTKSFVLTFGLLGIAFGQAEPRADIVLNGVITRADYHTYREVPFTVPKGIARLTINLSYTRKEQLTTIDLGLFDGERFRGWSGGNKAELTISETDATPSYLPGPIRPGVWKLVLGVPNIREGVRSEFQAHVYFSRVGTVTPGSSFSSVPVSTSSGWYRGDFHMHTGHSDGSCKNQSGRQVPCPVFKTAEAAVSRGLDFIAITDHNTMSQYDALRELQPYFDRLLFIPGREITTFEGHANVFGSMQFIDFRLTSPYVPTVAALLRQVHELGGLISINHPDDPSGEACMGCGWTAPDTDFHQVQAIEAINGGDSGTQHSGIPFWESQLGRGFRLTAIGGSDNHHADVVGAPSSIGHPTTVVYAENLSAAAVLDGIRSGRVFIDVEGTKDRMLELSANSAFMGGNLKVGQDAIVQFSIHIVHASGSHLEIIEDGHKVDLVSDPALKQADEVKNFELRGDGARHWIRVNVRSAEGHLLLVSNAVYMNF